MTDTNTAERESFEAWAKGCGYQSDELARCKLGFVSPAYFNLNTENAWKAWLARASLAASAGSEPVKRVFLVHTGEEHEGEATYTRHDDAPPPLCDSECLYTHPSPPEGMAGWRWVPVEPTEDMKAAAVKYANGPAVYKNVGAEVLRIEEGIYGEVYEAMIAAAPPIPASEAKEL